MSQCLALMPTKTQAAVTPKIAFPWTLLPTGGAIQQGAITHSRLTAAVTVALATMQSHDAGNSPVGKGTKTLVTAWAVGASGSPVRAVLEWDVLMDVPRARLDDHTNTAGVMLVLGGMECAGSPAQPSRTRSQPDRVIMWAVGASGYPAQRGSDQVA